jgi:hypothetical protein
VYRLLIAALLLHPVAAFGQEVFAVQGTERGKAYLMVVGEDGAVSVQPLRVVSVGGAPVPFPPVEPQPDPDPTDPNSPTLKVKALTATAISQGGTPTTALGLSSVYGLVADKLAAEAAMTPLDGLSLISSTTNAVLAMQTDGASWAAWRAGITAIVDDLQRQNKLPGKAEHVAFFREVSEGLKRGVAGDLQGVEYTKALLDLDMILHNATKGRGHAAAANLFGGIDIERLGELIKLIMFLFSLFGK